MAVTAESVSVGTTATALNDGTPGRIIVDVPSGAGQTVFIGGSDVDTTEGFPLSPDDRVAITVESGEVVFGIVAATTEAVNVLRS